MEDRPSDDAELPEPPIGADGTEVPAAGSAEDETPGGPAARALAMEAEEIRRLIEAGAGSPEAIRELAARLREHRAREEALWRTEVKPVLQKEGKGRLRGHTRPGATPRERSTSNAMWLGVVLLGLVVVVAVAAATTAWLLVLPVLALIAWAWYRGRSTSG